jgi:hypothetical protein
MIARFHFTCLEYKNIPITYTVWWYKTLQLKLFDVHFLRLRSLSKWEELSEESFPHLKGILNGG